MKELELEAKPLGSRPKLSSLYQWSGNKAALKVRAVHTNKVAKGNGPSRSLPKGLTRTCDKRGTQGHRWWVKNWVQLLRRNLTTHIRRPCEGWTFASATALQRWDADKPVCDTKLLCAQMWPLRTAAPLITGKNNLGTSQIFNYSRAVKDYKSTPWILCHYLKWCL